MNQIPDCHIAIDLNKEWSKIAPDSNIVTGVIVVRKEFLDNNKEAFDKFLDEYRKSTEFANDNIEECAELLEKHDIFKAAIAKKAMEMGITEVVFDRGGYIYTGRVEAVADGAREAGLMF